jgi:hypothetical protein
MAAPHVSGAVALLLDHYRRLGKVLTVDMAVRLLVHSSTTIRTTQGLDLAGAHEAGAGLIDVYNAAFTELLDFNSMCWIPVGVRAFLTIQPCHVRHPVPHCVSPQRSSHRPYSISMYQSF